jgi:hypothetical protein
MTEGTTLIQINVPADLAAGNRSPLEHAQTMAAHSSPRTTKLCDRRNDETALDEYEKVRI